MKFQVTLSLVLCFLHGSVLTDDLYSVLGVNKFASQREIKQAYKQLARKWHPDKNKAPHATDKFTKINEAYETLGDEERRSKYDRFGETSASQPGGQQQNFHQFFNGPFGGGFNFNFGGSRDRFLDKHIVTMRSYENKIEEDTYYRPYIFYVYSDFCIACMQIEHMIEHLFKDLEAVGIGIGAIHAGMDQGLRKYLYTHHYPAIVGVRNGRPIHFNGPVNMAALRDFARSLFPKDTLVTLSDENFDAFINGWVVDNKVRVVLFNNRGTQPAKYLVLAYTYRSTMMFGIVNAKLPTSQQIVDKLRVDAELETMFVFNEDTSPVATVSMSQISRSTMADMIENNRYLALPRLSNHQFFDTHCPQSTRSNDKKLCVVLVTTKSHNHPEHMATFRQFAQENSQERVKFLYIYADVQNKLLKALTKTDNDSLAVHMLKVVILWRMDDKRLGYEWLEGGWTINTDENSEEMLAERIGVLLKSRGHLPHRAVLPELYNEHALSLVTRIKNRLADWAGRFYDYITGHDSVTITMILFTIVMVAVVGILMRRMMLIEEESIQKKQKGMSENQPRQQLYNSRPNNRSAVESLILYELKDNSYETLVSKSDTGLTVKIPINKSGERRESLFH